MKKNNNWYRKTNYMKKKENNNNNTIKNLKMKMKKKLGYFKFKSDNKTLR
jgi:hypothetical protein